MEAQGRRKASVDCGHRLNYLKADLKCPQTLWQSWCSLLSSTSWNWLTGYTIYFSRLSRESALYKKAISRNVSGRSLIQRCQAGIKRLCWELYLPCLSKVNSFPMWESWEIHRDSYVWLILKTQNCTWASTSHNVVGNSCSRLGGQWKAQRGAWTPRAKHHEWVICYIAVYMSLAEWVDALLTLHFHNCSTIKHYSWPFSICPCLLT